MNYIPRSCLSSEVPLPGRMFLGSESYSHRSVLAASSLLHVYLFSGSFHPVALAGSSRYSTQIFQVIIVALRAADTVSEAKHDRKFEKDVCRRGKSLSPRGENARHVRRGKVEPCKEFLSLQILLMVSSSISEISLRENRKRYLQVCVSYAIFLNILRRVFG